MLGEEISLALNEVPDEMLKNAMGVYERKKKERHIWKRAIACAAVLAIVLTAILWPAQEENYITAPGLLTVRAYALDGEEISDVNSTVLTEGIELPLSYNWAPNINVVPGLPLNLSLDESGFEGMNITFEVTVSDGSFRQKWPVDFSKSEYEAQKGKYLGTQFTVKNDHTIYWLPWVWKENKAKKEFVLQDTYADYGAYVDIIIRADDLIIGYAVVEIYAVNEILVTPEGYKIASPYSARILEIISFPKVDGEFQNVSESYVEGAIAKAHKIEK